MSSTKRIVKFFIFIELGFLFAHKDNKNLAKHHSEYKEMLTFHLLNRDFYPLTLQRYKYGFDPTSIFQIIGGKIGFLKSVQRV